MYVYIAHHLSGVFLSGNYVTCQLPLLSSFSISTFDCFIVPEYPFCLESRSPWSNVYDPPLEDGAMPSERLRKLEIDANSAFDQYREL